jgi:hypothetical protein
MNRVEEPIMNRLSTYPYSPAVGIKVDSSTEVNSSQDIMSVIQFVANIELG